MHFFLFFFSLSIVSCQILFSKQIIHSLLIHNVAQLSKQSPATTTIQSITIEKIQGKVIQI